MVYNSGMKDTGYYILNTNIKYRQEDHDDMLKKGFWEQWNVMPSSALRSIVPKTPY